MKQGTTDIWVYADWEGLGSPLCIGILTAQQAKGRKAFSFAYDKNWIQTAPQFLLDPDIQWAAGQQYATKGQNFGVFLDSMPDTWGQTLMKRRELQRAAENKQDPATLYDIDFLLGVNDETRMGALRFKTNPDGPFENADIQRPTPPLYMIRELQHAASVAESDDGNTAIKDWLDMLIAPGSSLGGARPKANILDNDGSLLIAKFPSKNDTTDKAAWEYLACQLARDTGIRMSESRIERISGRFHTFFTKRFDRNGLNRVHFSSAMTMTGNNEDTIKDNPASYLDMAEFIQYHGSNIQADLHELWKRMVFNMAVSNTDDHLRNHGFMLDKKGWRLSPAYDINPSVDKNGLALNVDSANNQLSFGLAKSVGEYFQLDDAGMDAIIKNVTEVVNTWQAKAAAIGINRAEQELMKGAFLRKGI